jgi:hypothetical protein
MTLYKSRSSAIRAAREAARKALGPQYEAAEPYDFIICPTHVSHEHWTPYVGKGRIDLGDRFGFTLVGSAAHPNEEEREIAKRSWERHHAKA